MIIKVWFVLVVVAVVVVVVVEYSSCHKVKLINPGELVDLRVMGCKDGKWHDFVNGVSFPEDAVVELTPGNVTEFVCVRGTEMETLVMIMMKQGMTFLTDRSEGRWRSENVTFVCSIEVWTQTLKLFHLSIISKSRKKRKILDKVSTIRDGSLISMTVNYTYHDDDDDDGDYDDGDGDDDGDDGDDDDDDDGDGDDDDDNGNDDLMTYSCNWEIQFDESEREMIESQSLKVKIFEPVNRVRPGSTTIASNTTLQCLAKGFPAPHLCTCDLRTLPNHTHLSPGGSPLQSGSYLVTCLAKNSIRGEIYNSTWIGYLDVQSKKSCGLGLAKGLEYIFVTLSSFAFCQFYNFE